MPHRLLDRAFVLTSAIVMFSTIGFQSVRGYGTVLFQVVALTAWRVLASATSGTYADQHHSVLWIIAAGINLVAFWILAMPLWALGRKRPRTNAVVLLALAGFCVFYVASLSWLFPATDGP